MQGLPLDDKVRMTKRRITEWVDEFGVDGVYVSFSGGKDSTVLLTIARQMYPDIKAVFVDTGLEYPEIRQFVRTWDNVEWLKPKKTFKQVINDYGYPFISKEVSERVYYAQKYLTWYFKQNSLDRPTDRPTPFGIMDLFGVKRKSEEWRRIVKTRTIPNRILEQFARSGEPGSYKIKKLVDPMTCGDGTPTQFDYRKWKWLASCPYMISNHCCGVMKKSPVHSYAKKEKRNPITAQMASESRLRTQQWLKNGCNGFNLKLPTSNPMSFWTEQDVLLYIYNNKIPIASVYGDVVIDYKAQGELDGQMRLSDLGGEWELFDINRPLLKTTGCKRTGCMFCGYGCHFEKPGEGRFERMKVTHPKQYNYIMKPKEEGGLGYKEVIDWLNEHGDLHIRY